MGILWVTIKATEYFFSDFIWVQKNQDYWYVFLFIGVIFGIIRALPKTKISKSIDGTDVNIEVKIKDIFASNKSIIVGCNTTFKTSVKKNIIDLKSIQGQYLKKYFENENELNKQVKKELSKLPANSKIKPNANEYEMGTTIVVGKERRAYLVAIASLNKHNNAETNSDSFFRMLPKMWSEIRSKGNMEAFDCPILGSNFARLNIKRQELLIELIRSFIVATREGKLTESITFYILPNDFKKSRINMEEIRNLLDYECKQSISARTIKKSGTPIGD